MPPVVPVAVEQQEEVARRPLGVIVRRRVDHDGAVSPMPGRESGRVALVNFRSARRRPARPVAAGPWLRRASGSSATEPRGGGSASCGLSGSARNGLCLRTAARPRRVHRPPDRAVHVERIDEPGVTGKAFGPIPEVGAVEACEPLHGRLVRQGPPSTSTRLVPAPPRHRYVTQDDPASPTTGSTSGAVPSIPRQNSWSPRNSPLATPSPARPGEGCRGSGPDLESPTPHREWPPPPLSSRRRRPSHPVPHNVKTSTATIAPLTATIAGANTAALTVVMGHPSGTRRTAWSFACP